MAINRAGLNRSCSLTSEEIKSDQTIKLHDGGGDHSFEIISEEYLSATNQCSLEAIVDELSSSRKRTATRNRMIRNWLRYSSYFFPFSVGLVVPVIGGMNKYLEDEVGNVYFVIALLYSLAAVLTLIWTSITSRYSFRENWTATSKFISRRPWNFLVLSAGLAGVAQHIILTLVSASGGAALYTLGMLLGSIVTSIILDVFGICWAKKACVSWFAFCGAFIVGSGAIVHSFSSFLNSANAGISIGRQLGFLGLSISSGVLLCFQSCASNKLGELCGEFRRSIVWSYFSGSVALWLIAPFIPTKGEILRAFLPQNWWKSSQVFLAIWVSVIVTIFQYKLNAGVVYCWVVTGLLFSSTLVDSFGWIGLRKRPLSILNVCGLLIVFVGIVVITYSKLEQEKRLVTKSQATSDEKHPTLCVVTAQREDLSPGE